MMATNHETAFETNPENGEVTMYLANVAGGPVVTGINLEDAQRRMKEATDVFQAVEFFRNHPSYTGD